MHIIFLYTKPFGFLFKLGNFGFHTRNWQGVTTANYAKVISLSIDRQGFRMKVFKRHFFLNFQDTFFGEETRTDHLDPDPIRVTHFVEDSTGGQWKVESGYFLKSRKRSPKVEKVPAWIYTELVEGATPFSAYLKTPPTVVIENIVQLRHSLDDEPELKK